MWAFNIDVFTQINLAKPEKTDFEPERQQISHRICNIWRCQQIAARNLTEFVDILYQQIGDRN